MEHKCVSRPLLSILIATRNRIPYAISAIESILEVPDARIELVVQDNSETRELERHVRDNCRDGRIRYAYTPPPFSGIDNFNAVLALATGEYLCLIGDDDGVNPEIVEAAAWAKEQDLDALAPRMIVSYTWPFTSNHTGLTEVDKKGNLKIQGFSGRIESADLEKELARVMGNGCTSYLQFNLPKLYHGIVHRRCLEAIRERTGAYVGGLSPDIFTALGIACVAKRVKVIDYPLTIAGACEVSSSIVEGRNRSHSKRLEDAPHLRDRGPYVWCDLVPRIYCLETIWADSGVGSLRAMGRHDLVARLNLAKLATDCMRSNPSEREAVWRDYRPALGVLGRHGALGVIKLRLALLAAPGVRFWRRAINRCRMILSQNRTRSIDDIKNMREVTRTLTSYLHTHGYAFRKCVSDGP